MPGVRGRELRVARKAFNREGRKENPQKGRKETSHPRDTEAQKTRDLVIGSSDDSSTESQLASREYRFPSPFYKKMASRARSMQLIRAQECACHTLRFLALASGQDDESMILAVVHLI